MKFSSVFRFGVAALVAAAAANDAGAGYEHDLTPCSVTAVAGGGLETLLGGDGFWGICYNGEDHGQYIKSVTIDLRAGLDVDAFFHFSGLLSSKPKLGSVSGILESEVHFSSTTGTPSVLTLEFDDDCFGAGDYVFFDANVGAIAGLGLNVGQAIGLAEVGIQVEFSSGETYSGVFQHTSLTASAAVITDIDCHDGKPATGVPTPSAALAGMALLGLVGARRRQK